MDNILVKVYTDIVYRGIWIDGSIGNQGTDRKVTNVLNNIQIVILIPVVIAKKGRIADFRTLQKRNKNEKLNGRILEVVVKDNFLYKTLLKVITDVKIFKKGENDV